MRIMYIWTLMSLLIMTAVSHKTTAQKKTFTFDDVFSAEFAPAYVPGFAPMKDEQFYSAISNNAGSQFITKYKVSGREKVEDILNVSALMNGIEHRALSFDSYVFNSDETMILLLFNGEHIYRRSVKYITYLYNRETGALLEVDSTPVLHASLSPSGDKIAYVKDNNLYVFDIASRSITAVTTDGKWNHIINGNCDWVYEEEFSFTKAFQWSPDGKNIAYYKFDESRVKEFTMAVYDGLYPTQYSFKYPKAGEDNSIVDIYIYPVETGHPYKIQLDSTTEDFYIPRIQWANNDELLILKLNRLQNELNYIFHNITSKSNTTEFTDKNQYYVDIVDPITFYNKGNNMIFLSEKSGYLHIHELDRRNRKERDLTPYPYDVQEVLGYQHTSGHILFTASPENAINNGIFSVNVKNSKVRTILDKKGWYTVTPFPSLTTFMVTHSTLHDVPQSFLINDKGQVLQKLEDNKALSDKNAAYHLANIEMTTFIADDNMTTLHGYIMKPHNFDPSVKYPVLMYQYSGPGSQEVRNRYNLGNRSWHQYLTTLGYLVVCIDGRGTGNRGEAFKKMTYLQLGKYETDDQIAAGRQLAQLPYVDENRIGIWGWSYGGFMSANCILKGNDVFSTAISVAPVTHWALYDNIYTERFMRTPLENPDGYNDNSPLYLADSLKGHLLLIHGTADDNVHFQNAVMLTDALIQAGKQFESIYYPNGNHGIGGGIIRKQLYRKMTDYVLDKL